MVNPVELTDLKVSQLWREVKDEDSESFWGDLAEDTRLIVKRLLESALEAEMIARLQARQYQRNPDRVTWRNGHYHRNVLTTLGFIEGLAVPRARGTVEPSRILERYRQRQGQINELVKEMFLRGVSTRAVGEVLEPLLDTKLSAPTVSAITASLDREVALFLSRPLRDEFAYLLLDGITLKVKTVEGVKKRLVLVAYGITEQGRRQIVAFRLARAESEAQWEAFLSDLYRRGLCGERLRLICTDGCPGLRKALDTVYPYVPRQHCWVHKLRNVAQRLPRRLPEACLNEAKLIYQAETKREAKRRFQLWAAKWRAEVPAAVACLEKDLDELVAFLECPREDWRTVRTTNAIERAFREVRRRTRPMSCFTNSASCRRVIFGIISHLNQRWEDRAKSTHNS